VFDYETMLCFRFVVVCGDGEYIIYTAMALRNKSFGSAQEFVWSHEASMYAVRESNSSIKIFKNFKEQKSFKPDFGAEGITFIYKSTNFGGQSDCISSDMPTWFLCGHSFC